MESSFKLGTRSGGPLRHQLNGAQLKATEYQPARQDQPEAEIDNQRPGETEPPRQARLPLPFEQQRDSNAR